MDLDQAEAKAIHETALRRQFGSNRVLPQEWPVVLHAGLTGQAVGRNAATLNGAPI